MRVLATKAAGDDPGEQDVAEVILRALQALGSSLSLDAIRQAIARGDTAPILRGLDFDGLAKNLVPLANALHDAYATTGAAQVAGLVAGASMTLGFDLIETNAIRWAEREAGRLIVQVSDGIRDVVRGHIVDALTNHITVDATAVRIRTIIPLTERMAAATNRRFDRIVAESLAAGKTPAEAAADAARGAARAVERAVERRAWIIARTELMTASNEGRAQGWRDAIESGGLSPESRKMWTVGPNACPDCDPIDGETILWTETFSIGEDMPPAHPGCRCTAVLLPPDVDTRAGKGDAEKALHDGGAIGRAARAAAVREARESALRVLAGDITPEDHDEAMRRLGRREP